MERRTLGRRVPSWLRVVIGWVRSEEDGADGEGVKSVEGEVEGSGLEWEAGGGTERDGRDGGEEGSGEGEGAVRGSTGEGDGWDETRRGGSKPEREGEG